MKFLVIQDVDKIKLLKDECINAALESSKKREGFDPGQMEALREKYTRSIEGYLSAPAYVIVLVDRNSKYPGYNIKDGSLAAGYLIIAARSLGYGTVFVTDAVPYALIKKVFEIPDRFVEICFIPIGIPESWPQSPEKKPLGNLIAFEKLIEGINY